MPLHTALGRLGGQIRKEPTLNRRPDFEALFGRPPTTTAEAAGRVNLIGEHTDYNDGFVLPTLLARRTQVELAARDGGLVRAWSAQLSPDERLVSFALGDERQRDDWLDFVQGVTKLLAESGRQIGGFDVRVDSNVPSGNGLASSAALTVALLRALGEQFGLSLGPMALALLAQRVENDFVGAQVGIMDPLVVSLGREGQALFVDSRGLTYEQVPLPTGGEWLIVDSGQPHRHSSGGYNARRAECRAAAAALRVDSLRDIALDDLRRLESLPEPLGRRARHVVTENARVLEAVVALRAGDLPRLGQLLVASHRSQRYDYEVSVPEIDRLVDLALMHSDVYGARLTGGGFGGAALILARTDSEGVAAAVVDEYEQRFGPDPRILMMTAN